METKHMTVIWNARTFQWVTLNTTTQEYLYPQKWSIICAIDGREDSLLCQSVNQSIQSTNQSINHLNHVTIADQTGIWWR